MGKVSSMHEKELIFTKSWLKSFVEEEQQRYSGIIL
jgi:hypothetical protein